MLIETKQMMPITRLQKELTRTVRELADSGNEVYIVKNNTMESVLVSYYEYEHLKDIEEIFEQLEIKSMLDIRLSGYDQRKNVLWENIKEDV
jgi:PHD/YefM family antitoxin component YafN of YafNO toxin-antitoxin module